MDKLKKALGVAYKCSPFLLIAFGICCLIFHHDITSVFSYVFASIVLLIGVLGLTLTLMNLVKSNLKPTSLAYGITLIILGIVFFVKAEQAEVILLIGVSWSLVSIVKGTMQLAYGLEQVKLKMKRSIFNFFQAAFSITLGVMLIVDISITSIGHHVILFGVELIISSVAIVGGLEEEVSLWQMLNIRKKEENTAEEGQEISEEKKAS